MRYKQISRSAGGRDGLEKKKKKKKTPQKRQISSKDVRDAKLVSVRFTG